MAQLSGKIGNNCKGLRFMFYLLQISYFQVDLATYCGRAESMEIITRENLGSFKV